MKRAIAGIAAFVLIALPTLTAAAHFAQNGTWTIQAEKAAGQVEIDLRQDGAGEPSRVHDSRDFSMQMLGLQPADLNSAPHPVHFTLRRDAGVIDFTGTMGNGAGAGRYTFTPSAAYAQAIAARGMDRPDEEKEFVAVLLDISLPYMDSIIAAGVRLSSFDKLIPLRALGITAASIQSLQRSFGPMNEDDLITFTALHITPEYATQMRALGVTGLTTHDLVTLKALHVDSEYVRRVQAHGFKHPTAQQLVQLKAMHIL